mmetsp:Transcript_14497/g.25137  ORF Transcript_14497/g.25137 Transcript_14497/m.25137 type:complete len:187 (-) Transcript_14497:256-816(-)
MASCYCILAHVVQRCDYGFLRRPPFFLFCLLQVYKLVEWKGYPRIKLSQELPKATMPGRKRAYRLYGKDGKALVDYISLATEDPPVADGDGVICRHPFKQQQRLKVFASRVEPLHHLVFDGSVAMEEVPKDLSQTQKYVLSQIHDSFPESITRYNDPEVYNVMVSLDLYQSLHATWEKEAPLEELD